MIQFSSGSTGNPKGAILSHENMSVNTYAVLERFGSTDIDINLSWLPFTHNMAMAMFLTSMAAHMNQYIMPTALFAVNPKLWLDKASEHKATQLSTPNFGIKLILELLEKNPQLDWDLSRVRFIINGAEPISCEVCNRFTDKMSKFGLRKSAINPGYGLTE
jgi:acyl-CoA synthetase (AMP-forming)/AMP-acid ligase II